MSLLQERRLARYMDVSSGSALGHTFIVGGAAIYRHVLTTTSPAWALENLLVTRIMRPHAENESYDVFLDEFRSEKQQTWEEDTAKACVDVLPTDERLCPDELDDRAVWRQATSAEHKTFLADAPHAAQVGQIFHDKGIAIQFQLWRRRDLPKDGAV